MTILPYFRYNSDTATPIIKQSVGNDATDLEKEEQLGQLLGAELHHQQQRQHSTEVLELR